MLAGLPGRNDACPCGSGKKYKKCCMGTDAASRAKEQAAHPNPFPPLEVPEHHLDDWSNSARSAIKAGRLEEAEALIARLVADYPEAQDGYELRGRVREAQGRWAEAAQAYQEALAALEAMGPDWVDPEVFDEMRRKRDAAKARGEGR